MTEAPSTYAFRYDRWCGWLLGLLGHGRRLSRVRVDATTVDVRMGLAFRASVPRASVVQAAPYDGRVWGWGVHGWRGRWLVNGSSQGLVTLTIDPPTPARVLGIPVRLRQLIVSLVDRDAFLARLGASGDTR